MGYCIHLSCNGIERMVLEVYYNFRTSFYVKKILINRFLYLINWKDNNRNYNYFMKYIKNMFDSIAYFVIICYIMSLQKR